jgi:hypothetical protein
VSLAEATGGQSSTANCVCLVELSQPWRKDRFDELQFLSGVPDSYKILFNTMPRQSWNRLFIPRHLYPYPLLALKLRAGL